MYEGFGFKNINFGKSVLVHFFHSNVLALAD